MDRPYLSAPQARIRTEWSGVSDASCVRFKRHNSLKQLFIAAITDACDNNRNFTIVPITQHSIVLPQITAELKAQGYRVDPPDTGRIRISW